MSCRSEALRIAWKVGRASSQDRRVLEAKSFSAGDRPWPGLPRQQCAALAQGVSLPGARRPEGQARARAPPQAPGAAGALGMVMS